MATKPDAFTTGPQRAISPLIHAVNSAEDKYAGSVPNLARLSIIYLERDASRMAALSASTVASAVLAGRNTPEYDSTTTL